MYYYVSFFTVVSILLYPITVISTFQRSNVALWQGVLFSILTQTESSPIADIKDMNGDAIIDVRDLCIVAQKIKNEKSKIPTSKTLKDIVYNSPIRTDKILLSLKNCSHQNNVKTNIGQDEEGCFIQYNAQILKGVKLNISIKKPFFPLLC